MVGVDAVLGDAKIQECLTLGGQVLLVGGAASVSDERCRHERKCTDRGPLADSAALLRHYMLSDDSIEHI